MRLGVLLQHDGDKDAHTMNHAPEIDADDPFPIGDGVFPDGGTRTDTGVVAEQVNSAKDVEGLLGQCLDVAGL